MCLEYRSDFVLQTSVFTTSHIINSITSISSALTYTVPANSNQGLKCL